MIDRDKINERVDVLIDADNSCIDWVDHCKKWRDKYRRNISDMDASDIQEMRVFLQAKLDILIGNSR